MRTLVQHILEVASFFWVIPGRVVKSPPDDNLRKISRYFPWIAGPFGAAGNCLAALVAFPLCHAGVARGVPAAFLLTAFYLVRGLKLIDGYIDLAEGISLSWMRGVKQEEAWRAIRNPCRGSFGILWGIILIVWQLIALETLAAHRFGSLIGLWGAAGLLSSASLCIFHVGGNRYHPDSRFRHFGGKIGQTRSALAALALSTGLAWFFLSALHVSVTTRLLILALAVASGLTAGIVLRFLVLRTLRAFNGDVIGFVVLISEVFVLSVIAQSGLI